MTKSSVEYAQFVQLFHDWRNFENPLLLNGAPDYTVERFKTALSAFQTLQQRLRVIGTRHWSREQKIDWQIVQAEMNGYDFNSRILQPWARDPAFYQTLFMEQSDVPAREGPVHHAVIDVWQYQFPLSTREDARLSHALSVIPPLLEQARCNLTGNARDLWLAGIRNIEQQQRDIHALQNQLEASASNTLAAALRAALHATRVFSEWLQEQAVHKTGPSGLGIEQYNWYQKHVHLVPLDWQRQVFLMQRELDRAWSALKLEEQRNQHLPPLQAAGTPAEWAQLADQSAHKLMNFLREKNIMPIKSNMEPALRAHLLDFVAPEKRNFFDICRHYNPLPQYCHWYHWFDLAQIRDEPHSSPIRRSALLYNIWDSRNEGIATGVEEWFMHMGLMDDNPRVREIIWVMLAQRAARGLGSLYAHANQMTMQEAAEFHKKWTPRNWMDNEPELLQYEQQLYLRQPGYGTSYIVGKYLFEQLIKQKAQQQESRGGAFVMREFFKGVNEMGCVPIALAFDAETAE